jgi:uncharacterized membrane protein YphA (DoxX/SURF4 family)
MDDGGVLFFRRGRSSCGSRPLPADRAGFRSDPYAVVVATGLCEIVGSIALLTGRLRRLAGVMLAIYAVCVFPANIKHAVEGIHVPSLPQNWWYHGLRLIMQPVLVWWALFCAEVIDWPCWKRSPRPASPA